MIIQLRLTDITSPFIIQNLPYLNVEDSLICVKTLIIEFKNRVETNSIFSLQSSLVDQSSCNPNQVIASFLQRKTDKVVDFKPTQNEYYKCQCSNLNDSVLKLSCSKDIKNNKITAFVCHLEILDARV